MSENQTVSGGCLCGAVKFSAELPSKWCAHCHCTMCRRAHGAGYVTWVGFEDSQFRIETGEDRLRWFASSENAQRGFCATCGSTMFFRSSKWAGEIHIALASIADPIDRKPQANVFHATHVDWMPLDDALAIFNPE
jgi:hypothetical protein